MANQKVTDATLLVFDALSVFNDTSKIQDKIDTAKNDTELKLGLIEGIKYLRDHNQKKLADQAEKLLGSFIK